LNNPSERKEPKAKKGDRQRQRNVYKEISSCIIENKYVVTFTTILTVWALTGSDFAMLLTSRSFDPIFNWLVGLMLVTFAAELVLSCLGKDDYFMGFFFWLDLISTATLILDLTFVADYIQGNSEEDGGADDMRSGRAAKIGAKAGRVVRVLRLVRILKLYKAYYDAKMRKKKQEERLARGELEEDEWDDADLEGDPGVAHEPGNESRVGKKLSEITTRRVIILILAMLLLLPFLQVDVVASNSADYGADYILETFIHFENKRVSKGDYEKSLLQYAYYHNWFASEMDFCGDKGLVCAEEYYGHVFWIGVMGSNKTAVELKSGQAQIRGSTVSSFNTNASMQNNIYNYGIMPTLAQNILGLQWNTKCDSPTRFLRGISLLSQEMEENSERINCPDELRPAERQLFYPRTRSEEAHNEWNFAFYFDLRQYTRQSAIYSILTTAFVLVLLIAGSLMFSSDANRLVVNPVEKMIKRVELIGANPLIAMKMADEEFKAEEVAKAKMARQRKEHMKMMFKQVISCQLCNPKDPKGNEPMETVVLEKTIIKLGSLLALGFGEAGANIIGHNMSGCDSAGVNAMIPGTRVNCIIGVARVRDFSTATEVLQAKIMTFVNQIAEIVHGVVNEFHGAPNKNNGDSFLIIWRLDASRENGISSQRISEMSIIAFANILGSLHKSPILASYRGHPGLQMRLGTKCRVNLSFGLHLGWAIEGAVGSEFKIDASYLSPNVSIATSVERATAIYGVSLIVAQSVIENCSLEMAKQHRLIDRVIITGSAQPMGLYCLDLDYLAVEVSTDRPLTVVWSTHNRFKARQTIESQKGAKVADDFQVCELLRTDKTLICMRQRFTTEFFELFNMGYQNYSQGEWQVARRMLSCTRAILGIEDGPSNAILRFMDVRYGFEAPKCWRGIREVDTKQSGSS
jgi:class 3 adenylate cyclase